MPRAATAAGHPDTNPLKYTRQVRLTRAWGEDLGGFRGYRNRPLSLYVRRELAAEVVVDEDRIEGTAGSLIKETVGNAVG